VVLLIQKLHVIHPLERFAVGAEILVGDVDLKS
jgi:hypothetical protein